jgi:hypothetical protein
MSSINYRPYKNYSRLVLKTIGSNKFISIYYAPSTIAGVYPEEFQGDVRVHTDNFSHVHDTPFYATEEEAMAHAEGYVDCLHHFYKCRQTYTNENKDSYPEARNKELQEHNFVIPSKNRYGQGLLTPSVSSIEKLINVLEEIYKKGWDEKLSELENIDEEVGD